MFSTFINLLLVRHYSSNVLVGEGQRTNVFLRQVILGMHGTSVCIAHRKFVLFPTMEIPTSEFQVHQQELRTVHRIQETGLQRMLRSLAVPQREFDALVYRAGWTIHATVVLIQVLIRLACAL